MFPAIFIDLDNTLIHTKSGKTFPVDKDDYYIDLNVIKGLSNLLRKSRKYKRLIIVSNQGGIARGFVDEKEFIDKISAISEYIKGKLNIEVYYLYCPKMKSYFRKPNPGMAYKAALKFELDLKSSIMIGDASGKIDSFSDSDKVFAKNSGIKTYIDIKDFIDVFVRTNKS